MAGQAAERTAEQTEGQTVERIGEQRVLAVPDQRFIRDELQRLVLADLLGPLGGPDEEFREDPLDRYIVGRLAPNGVAVEPETQDERPEAAAPDLLEGEPEPNAPNVPSLTPSALGFTACVDGAVSALAVTAAWAQYERVESQREEFAGRRVWQRQPRGGTVHVPLVEGTLPARPVDPEQPQVVVRGRARRRGDQWLVSLFLENQQRSPARREPKAWLFQVELSAAGVDGAAVFLPVPHQQVSGGDGSDRREQQRLAMAYRFSPQFAVGHGTAVRAELSPDDPQRAVAVRTATVPEYELPFTDVPSAEHDPDLPELAQVELDMKRLAELAVGPAELLTAALRPLVDGYRAWIDRNEASVNDPARRLDEFAQSAREALADARRAADRIEAGIDLLAGDAEARRAFGFANRAMYLQRVHSVVAADRRHRPHVPLAEAENAADHPDNHRWRPFQLAFVLLNLPAVADPLHPERSDDRRQALADLLWFPTGGGKTEAYLGLTAFTIAIRRRQPAYGGRDPGGLAVLMRYTLRLLTIQQYERATTLICAAETLRREDPATWGQTPIRIGLWVGGAVTPNRVEDAEEWLKQRRGQRGQRGQGSPHQLTTCPWCGSRIEAGRDIFVELVYRRTLVICPDHDCPFGKLAGFDLPEDQRGLPVLVVDEEIYRYPPALLIATVDKFAQLPWRGETAALFGRVRRRCQRHGYLTEDMEAADWEAASHRAKGAAPAARIVDCPELRPPDLIIQDELHLISGPLGSLVGLYETAVDRLASWEPRPGRWSRPKVIASTATVRRAHRQISALFDRRTEVFPPSGLDAADSFFARQRPARQRPGRRYVGICAHGVRIKSALIRVYVSVLGAAQKLHETYGRNPVTDPYMTLVGYFNSLRDLGGMRRLVEDDVSTRLTRADERGLARRYDPELKELTSRLPSDAIRPLLDQLGVTFVGERPKGSPPPISVLLATSMIAVGVDVPRLGIMVVANQPKSTAEYIQATSRVGRAAPGLVFTVYNWARPRDLSHYETFDHYHANVYRQVEALSVTPFAERAVDRGLTGVLVALVRDLDHTYNGNLRASEFDRHGQLADHVVRFLKRRSEAAGDQALGRRVEDELEARLDRWARERAVPARRLAYDKPYRADDVAGLLRRPQEGRWTPTTCPTSLRDVEPNVQLQLHLPVAEQEQGQEPPFVARDTPTTSQEVR